MAKVKAETGKTVKVVCFEQQLEQQLGKLQYDRMQIDATITPLQKKFNDLTTEIVRVSNEITTLKAKKKE